MADWLGNITVILDGKENTFSSGNIKIERYNPQAISLEFKSADGRVTSIVRLTPKDCKELIFKLVQVL